MENKIDYRPKVWMRLFEGIYPTETIFKLKRLAKHLGVSASDILNKVTTYDDNNLLFTYEDRHYYCGTMDELITTYYKHTNINTPPKAMGKRWFVRFYGDYNTFTHEQILFKTYFTIERDDKYPVWW